MKSEPRDSSEEIIIYHRLWRGFNDANGWCFSCENRLEGEITCDFCLTNVIILDEALHCDELWSNIGKSHIHFQTPAYPEHEERFG